MPPIYVPTHATAPAVAAVLLRGDRSDWPADKLAACVHGRAESSWAKA
jgi:hypothetical protein